MARQLAAALILGLVLAGCSGGPPPLSFAPEELPTGQVGEPYEARIRISGNRTPVFLFSAPPEDLPPGLRLELEAPGSDTGLISGTPTAAGSFTFPVSVACFGTNEPGQTGERAFTIEVAGR